MHVTVVEELATDGLPCSALEEDIVRHDDGGAAIDRKDRFHMLDEVQLLVRGRRPEVVALVGLTFLRDFALLPNDRVAALLAERWIREHDVEPFTWIGSE